MSELVKVALISTLVPGVFGVLNLILFFYMRSHFKETKAAIDLIEKHTNSMHNDLVTITAEAEFAKGLKVGQESK